MGDEVVQEHPASPATPGPVDSDAIDFGHRMFDLARSGDAELLSLVDAGVPVGLTDPAGNSLLMLASYHEHFDLTVGLAARGADPNAVNDRGQTPLAGAVFKANPAIIRALMAAGADPNLGQPSARESAQFFQRPELLVLLA